MVNTATGCLKTRVTGFGEAKAIAAPTVVIVCPIVPKIWTSQLFCETRTSVSMGKLAVGFGNNYRGIGDWVDFGKASLSS
jgi:hypothetical protein